MERRLGDFVSDFWLRQYGMRGDETVQIRLADPRTLLCPGRLDLVSKLLYVRSRLAGRERAFARALYRACIRAFLGPRYEEVGTAGKTGIRAHYRQFDALIDSAVTRGLDPAVSAASLTAGGVVIDGAHRAAVAYVLGQPLPVFSVPGVERNCNDAFFASRGLDPVYRDSLAYGYASLVQHPAALVLRVPSEEARRITRGVVSLCAPLACECALDGDRVLYVLGSEQAWTPDLLLAALSGQGAAPLEFCEGAEAVREIRALLRIGTLSFWARHFRAGLALRRQDRLLLK